MKGLFQKVVGERMEGKVIRRKGERKKREMKKKLSREKVRKVIRKLKDGKTMGMDRIPNEVEVWGEGRDMEEWV